MRAALIEVATGIVVNVIVVDEDFVPPDGFIVVPSDTASIGDSYVDGEFFPPAPEVPA